MKPRKLKANIYWVGAVDWDRRLFDELTPLPDGTSYNVYLIKGMLSNLKVELLEPVVTKGFPKDEDFKALDKLADEILNKHKCCIN